MVGVMKADLSRLEQENSSLLSDLGAGTGDRLLLDGLVSSLKSQVETLREELVSIQKAHIEKMETSLSKLDRAWEDKMTSLRDSQSRNLENAFITCRKAHREEITELTAKFDRERKSLEHSLVRLSSSASDESKRAQSDLINTAEMLQAEKDSHALSVTMFNQQIKEDREVSEQRLEAELETLRAAAQAAAEERERLTCEGHEAVVVLMKAMYRKAIGASKSKYSNSCFFSSIFGTHRT